jgi:glycosyltransferase involved in cell wall biosynthesis
MNIVQFHTRYRHAGGEDGVVDAEADVLRAGGHKVDQVFFANPTEPLAAAGTLIAAPWNPRAASRASSAVSGRPDLIHVHNTWFAAGPAVIRSLHRTAPVLVTLHNFRIACANALFFRDGRPCVDCLGTSGWAGIRHRCYRDSALASAAVSLTSGIQRRAGTWERDVDGVIAHSQFTADVFATSGVPRELIELSDNFTPDPGPRPAPPSASRDVVVVSRLSPEKGVDRVVAAWERSRTELQLIIVGDGPDKGRLEETKDARVHFVGRKPPAEVRQIMLGARALMFPSRWFESQPLVLLESLAAGLAPFASDHPPIRWVLEALGDGSLVPDDDDAWTATITAIEDDTTVDEVGRKARQLYVDRFTPATARTRLERLYQTAIKRHRVSHH